MRRWCTKEYWDTPHTPGLVVALLILFYVSMFFWFPKVLEYLTRP